MGLLLLVPGIILEIPDRPWFHDQFAVGNALIWIGVVLIVLQVLITLGILNFLKGR